MLIDIEKYVRQLLPPNRRLPKHIGLVTTLFSPIESIIKSFNDYKYDSQFDVGTPGQMAVLEYILQSYVHYNIKVLGADGVRLDFRVLVPEGLSQGDRGEVVRIVERYRLRSKRYEIKDSLDWGNGGDDPITGLAFSPSPTIVETSPGFWLVSYGVNQAGIWPTNLTNVTQGIGYLNNDIEYAAGSQKNFQVTTAGEYDLHVGSLHFKLVATATEIVSIAPNWLLGIGLTNDVNSRDASLWLNATTDCKLRLTGTDGVPISGITSNNMPFSDGVWIDGTTDWAAPWSEVFRLNPMSYGVGGLIAGKQYKIEIVRTSQSSPIFSMLLTIPTTSHIYPPMVVDLPTNNLLACEKGPEVYGMASYTQTGLSWYMDGKNVDQVKGYLKRVSDGAIIFQPIIDFTKIVDGVKVSVFSPGARGIYTFPTPVAPGIYLWGTEGSSCSSPQIYWSQPFTITAPNVPDPGPEPEPQTGAYIWKYVLECYPPHMTLDIVASPDGLGLLVTDLINYPVQGDFEVSYVINEQLHRGVGRLVNHLHHFPAPLSIRKVKNRIGIPGLYITGSGNSGGDLSAIQTFSDNTSYAQIDIICIKQ